MAKWPPKDPDEVLNYGFDWSPRDLGLATITVATAVVLEGNVVIDSCEAAEVEGVRSGQGTVTWLSGGAAGETCKIQHRAETTAGHKLDQTITIKIKER